jgi:thioredoxin 1
MSEPTRAEVDALPGLTLLELGASWCPHCQLARPFVDTELARRPDVRHIWIEDGSGKRLGRSFGVKLWPTLVLVRDGQEVARVVRPRSAREIEGLFGRLAA